MSEYAITVFQISEIFQRVWEVSSINAAIRIIPFGLVALITTFVVGAMAPYISPRWILVGGQLLILAGATLLAFSETRSTYWSHVFPAFILMPIGIASCFVFSNISMLRAPLSRPDIDLMETTSLIGAIFNANLQIGSSVGLAIVTAINTQAGHSDAIALTGYKAGWWFVVALAGFEALLAAIALRPKPEPEKEAGESTMVSVTSEKNTV
ncbi:hypothetical protein H0H87_011651 [Tephrocybe sp. NHM501043]|nr:hypothetical protein H0H87_011651 [Tephrocybe sp. NHM501043]